MSAARLAPRPAARRALTSDPDFGAELPDFITTVPIQHEPEHVAMYDPVTGVEFRVMWVSPELAHFWLKQYNTHNRGQRDRLIGAYAHDMKDGQWQFTGDPVRFGRDGLLYDGQHRLEAIVASNKGQRLLVVRGLLPAARSAIDGGATRKITDDLRLDGVTSVRLTTLTAIASRALYWEMGYRLPGGTKVRQQTRLEKINFIRSHPELEQCTRRGLQIQKATSKVLAPSIAGFVFWLALGVNEKDAWTFFEDLELAANWKKELSPNSPVKALLRRLKDSVLSDSDQLYLLLKAWIYFRSDRPSERLNLPKFRAQGLPMTADKIPDPAAVVGAIARTAGDEDEDAETSLPGL